MMNKQNIPLLFLTLPLFILITGINKYRLTNENNIIKNTQQIKSIDISNRDTIPPSVISIKAKSKSDFLPGEKLIAFENFSKGNISDFPERWNTSGSVEIDSVVGASGRWLWITRPGVLVPEFTTKYPEDFTFEFDLLHGVPINGGGLSISLAELDDISKPQHFWTGRNRLTIAFNTANTGSKTGFSTVNFRKNGTGETGNTAYTDLLSDKFNPVHIAIWRQKERVRVYINQEKIWDLNKALSKDANLNAMVFYTQNAEEKVKHYISNIRLGTGSSLITPKNGADSLSEKNNPKPPKTDSVVILNKRLPKSDSLPLNSQSYDFSNVRICIDKVNDVALPPRSYEKTAPKIPQINPDGSLQIIGVIRQELAGITEKMWSPGDVIKVGFLPEEGTTIIKDRIKRFVREWEKYANIKFEFQDSWNGAHIKVGINADKTSWSWLGRNVLYNPLQVKTMNFGWLTENTSYDEFSKVVLHEFGHALGLIHEHQSPTTSFNWDKEKVYAFFKEPPNEWSKSEVDAQVLSRYSIYSTNYSEYDTASIMHYFFPKSLTYDSVKFKDNWHLSKADTEYIRLFYPFPPTPKNATGIVRTGDDCDEINFSVEYDAVDPSLVEIILEPGIDHRNRLITWWKRIEIPLAGGTVQGMEMQGGQSATVTIPVNNIDATKGISFWKAKILGVHTLLPYKWNVLPAIIGGCRLKMIWRRDNCL